MKHYSLIISSALQNDYVIFNFDFYDNLYLWLKFHEYTFLNYFSKLCIAKNGYYIA